MKLTMTITMEVPESLERFWKKHGITQEELADRFYQSLNGEDDTELVVGIWVPSQIENNEALQDEHAELLTEMFSEVQDNAVHSITLEGRARG